MALLAEGMPTKLVATKLAISTRTAEHHRAAVLKKMGARTVSHLARMSMSSSVAGYAYLVIGSYYNSGPEAAAVRSN